MSSLVRFCFSFMMILARFCLSVLFVIFSTVLISSASSEKLKVVASIAPLADFAEQVGGKHVHVLLLLPPGASPHTFAPTPRIIREIEDAQVFIKIGAGLEFWADRIIASANKNIMVVECFGEIGLTQTVSSSHGDHDAHEVDPHIWLDPVLCIDIIRAIERAFSRAAPTHAVSFRKNALRYIKKLEALDRVISEKVKSFRIKEFVTFHPAWNYFSSRYGLKVIGVIKGGPDREPTPKHVGIILKELKGREKGIIFAEQQFSPKIAEAIAREAGGTVLILDPIGGQNNRMSYLDMMLHNLAVMEKAMK